MGGCTQSRPRQPPTKANTAAGGRAKVSPPRKGKAERANAGGNRESPTAGRKATPVKASAGSSKGLGESPSRKGAPTGSKGGRPSATAPTATPSSTGGKGSAGNGCNFGAAAANTNKKAKGGSPAKTERSPQRRGRSARGNANGPAGGGGAPYRAASAPPGATPVFPNSGKTYAQPSPFGSPPPLHHQQSYQHQWAQGAAPAASAPHRGRSPPRSLSPFGHSGGPQRWGTAATPNSNYCDYQHGGGSANNNNNTFMVSPQTSYHCGSSCGTAPGAGLAGRRGGAGANNNGSRSPLFSDSFVSNAAAELSNRSSRRQSNNSVVGVGGGAGQPLGYAAAAHSAGEGSSVNAATATASLRAGSGCGSATNISVSMPSCPPPSFPSATAAAGGPISEGTPPTAPTTPRGSAAAVAALRRGGGEGGARHSAPPSPAPVHYDPYGRPHNGQQQQQPPHYYPTAGTGDVGSHGEGELGRGDRSKKQKAQSSSNRRSAEKEKRKAKGGGKGKEREASKVAGDGNKERERLSVFAAAAEAFRRESIIKEESPDNTAAGHMLYGGGLQRSTSSFSLGRPTPSSGNSGPHASGLPMAPPPPPPPPHHNQNQPPPSPAPHPYLPIYGGRKESIRRESIVLGSSSSNWGACPTTATASSSAATGGGASSTLPSSSSVHMGMMGMGMGWDASGNPYGGSNNTPPYIFLPLHHGQQEGGGGAAFASLSHNGAPQYYQQQQHPYHHHLGSNSSDGHHQNLAYCPPSPLGPSYAVSAPASQNATPRGSGTPMPMPYHVSPHQQQHPQYNPHPYHPLQQQQQQPFQGNDSGFGASSPKTSSAYPSYPHPPNRLTDPNSIDAAAAALAHKKPPPSYHRLYGSLDESIIVALTQWWLECEAAEAARARRAERRLARAVAAALASMGIPIPSTATAAAASAATMKQSQQNAHSLDAEEEEKDEKGSSSLVAATANLFAGLSDAEYESFVERFPDLAAACEQKAMRQSLSVSVGKTSSAASSAADGVARQQRRGRPAKGPSPLSSAATDASAAEERRRRLAALALSDSDSSNNSGGEDVAQKRRIGRLSKAAPPNPLISVLRGVLGGVATTTPTNGKEERSSGYYAQPHFWPSAVAVAVSSSSSSSSSPPSIADPFLRLLSALGEAAVLSLFFQLWLAAHVTGWYAARQEEADARRAAAVNATAVAATTAQQHCFGPTVESDNDTETNFCGGGVLGKATSTSTAAAAAAAAALRGRQLRALGTLAADGIPLLALPSPSTAPDGGNGGSCLDLATPPASSAYAVQCCAEVAALASATAGVNTLLYPRLVASITSAHAAICNADERRRQKQMRARARSSGGDGAISAKAVGGGGNDGKGVGDEKDLQGVGGTSPNSSDAITDSAEEGDINDTDGGEDDDDDDTEGLEEGRCDFGLVAAPAAGESSSQAGASSSFDPAATVNGRRRNQHHHSPMSTLRRGDRAKTAAGGDVSSGDDVDELTLLTAGTAAFDPSTFTRDGLDIRDGLRYSNNDKVFTKTSTHSSSPSSDSFPKSFTAEMRRGCVVHKEGAAAGTNNGGRWEEGSAATTHGAKETVGGVSVASSTFATTSATLMAGASRGSERGSRGSSTLVGNQWQQKGNGEGAGTSGATASASTRATANASASGSIDGVNKKNTKAQKSGGVGGYEKDGAKIVDSVGDTLPRVGFIHAECLAAAYASLSERRALALRAAATQRAGVVVLERRPSFSSSSFQQQQQQQTAAFASGDGSGHHVMAAQGGEEDGGTVSPGALQWLRRAALLITPPMPTGLLPQSGFDAVPSSPSTAEAPHHQHPTVALLDSMAAALASMLPSTDGASSSSAAAVSLFGADRSDEVRSGPPLSDGATETAAAEHEGEGAGEVACALGGGKGGGHCAAVVGSSNCARAHRSVACWTIGRVGCVHDRTLGGPSSSPKAIPTLSRDQKLALEGPSTISLALSTHSLVRFHASLPSVAAATRAHLALQVGGSLSAEGQTHALAAAEARAERLRQEAEICGSISSGTDGSRVGEGPGGGAEGEVSAVDEGRPLGSLPLASANDALRSLARAASTQIFGRKCFATSRALLSSDPTLSAMRQAAGTTRRKGTGASTDNACMAAASAALPPRGMGWSVDEEVALMVAEATAQTLAPTDAPTSRQLVTNAVAAAFAALFAPFAASPHYLPNNNPQKQIDDADVASGGDAASTAEATSSALAVRLAAVASVEAAMAMAMPVRSFAAVSGEPAAPSSLSLSTVGRRERGLMKARGGRPVATSDYPPHQSEGRGGGGAYPSSSQQQQLLSSSSPQHSRAFKSIRFSLYAVSDTYYDYLRAEAEAAAIATAATVTPPTTDARGKAIAPSSFSPSLPPHDDATPNDSAPTKSIARRPSMSLPAAGPSVAASHRHGYPQQQHRGSALPVAGSGIGRPPLPSSLSTSPSSPLAPALNAHSLRQHHHHQQHHHKYVLLPFAFRAFVAILRGAVSGGSGRAPDEGFVGMRGLASRSIVCIPSAAEIESPAATMVAAVTSSAEASGSAFDTRTPLMTSAATLSTSAAVPSYPFAAGPVDPKLDLRPDPIAEPRSSAEIAADTLREMEEAAAAANMPLSEQRHPSASALASSSQRRRGSKGVAAG